jgi:hypothetical protein
VDDEGNQLKSPRDNLTPRGLVGAGGTTTPRSLYQQLQSNTTPRSYRGATPSTPSASDLLSSGNIFKNDDLPNEEFNDFF